jgi:hypothetical protein
MMQIDEMARKPSSQAKIGGECVEEITLGQRRASEQAPREIKVSGRKIFPAHVAIAALMHFLRLPRTERDAILRRELAAYEEMLTRDEPGEVFFPGERSVEIATGPAVKALPTGDRVGQVERREPIDVLAGVIPKNAKRPARK